LVWDRQHSRIDLDQRLLSHKPRLSILPPDYFSLLPVLMANMAKKKPVLEVVNSSGLTDADWIGINKVRRAYERGGWDGFWSEFETLGDDLILQVTVAGAFFPDAIREAIEDELAESGLALEDLREFVKKKEALAIVH
jgi:hypothetical protein